MQEFLSAGKAYAAPENTLLPILGPALTARFLIYRRTTDLVKLFNRIQTMNIDIVTQSDNRFPATLRSLPDSPICLYIRGATNLLYQHTLPFFAIVGTRNPTSYGTHIAYHFASGLAENGFVIVSGMALGIDAMAHRGAIDVQGKTIAVLGCGVDIVYPPSNKNIYNQIIQSGGAVISEFPPEHTVRRGLFVVRNRIISGLSGGVMVVEGTEKSGTLTTAKYAADQGKMVFAPPVPITSHLSRAPNLLLKQGAILVTEVDDILAEYGIRKITKITADLSHLSEAERKIVLFLQKEDCSIDELVIQMRCVLSIVLSSVSRLEMLGMIEQNVAGKYQLRLM